MKSGDFPLHDDTRFFELLSLEGAQAGLSWLTVLKKRNEYRRVFDGFDPVKVVAYDEEKIVSLLANPGIIRNRRKIESCIRNSRAFLDLCEEQGSFDSYIWEFVEGVPVVNTWKTGKEIPAVTPLAETISTDMQQRGFSFVGPTIIYALLQSAGLVNDHTLNCFRHSQCGMA